MMARATPPASAEKCPCRNDYDAVGHNSDYDRRHSVQHVRGEADDVAETVASVFRQVDACADSDGNSDDNWQLTECMPILRWHWPYRRQLRRAAWESASETPS